MKAQNVEILGLREIPLIGSRLVFRLDLPNGRSVFLSHESSSSSVPVLVDAQAFLALWRASPYEGHKYLAQGNPSSWRSDRKFPHAEDGFRAGATNPVPVPRISTYSRPRAPSLAPRPGFWSRVLGKALGHPSQLDVDAEPSVATGGLERSISVGDCTRTIWMLANGAAWMPVSANQRSVADLMDWGVGIPVWDAPLDAEVTRRSSAPAGL